MKGKPIWTIFWITVVFFFIAVVGTMLAPPILGTAMPYVIFPVFAVFAGLGIALLELTVKAKTTGKPRIFLLLTGAAAVGFPVSAILHNVFSGLFNTEEPVFFILATIVCPLAFLAGAVGTIVLTVKERAAA